MDNLDLIASLREINRKLQEENNQLKKDNKALVLSLERYEPKQDKEVDKKEVKEEERCRWGEGERGWNRY
jgi:hypothetical protein